jgi:SAM-dependent methyltransferase
MMSRPCPVCGSIEADRPFLEFADYQFFSDDVRRPKRVNLRNVVCRRCLTAYLNPVFTDTGYSILFAQAGRSYGAEESHVEAQVQWMEDRGVLRPGSAVLDVGCYEGGFLAALPDGLKLIGVDIDHAAIDRARQRLDSDAELFVEDFERFAVRRCPDVITMFHVLEHLARPAEVLAMLRDISHDRTELIVEVPIMEGRPSNDLVGFFTVQHTMHFSEHSLVQCLAKAGWEVVDGATLSGYNGHRVLCHPSEKASVVKGDPYDNPRLCRALLQWQHAVADVSIRVLDALREVDRCVIWGGGMHLEHLYATTSMFQANPEREYLIIDNDPTKQGQTWRGIDVQPPDVLSHSDCRGLPVVVSSYGSQTEITAAARERGVPADRIVTLYDSISAY